MWNVSLQVLGHLADASVRALGLAVVACVALAILRTRHAAVRHAVWSAVLAGMLALPMLALLLPPIAVKIMQRPPAAIAMIPRNPQAAERSTARIAPPQQPSAPIVPAWPMVPTGLYLAVMVASLTRTLLAWRSCRSLVRRSELIRNPRARDLLADVAAAQSMAWPLPQLRSSRSAIVPMTVGSREPVILLPPNWQDWDAWKLRAVLAHELAHIRRGDWLVAVAASANRCLFWFHPLAWWLERHLSALAEQASDDAALGHVTDASRYARTVLDFAAALQSGRRVSYGVAMARSAKVSRRIDRILAVHRPGPALVTSKTWAVIVACALPLIYSAAALQVEQPPSAPGVHPGLAQLLTEGSKLSPAEAQQLEEQLARDPDDLAARGKLISYYKWNAMDGMRHQHVYWLIQHHPEAEMTSYFSEYRAPVLADYEREKSLWLEQAAAHPSDARVLANAARFLGEKEPFVGRDLLERARQADPSNPVWTKRLADLFERAIFFSFAPPLNPAVDQAFGATAKAELESSEDAILIGTVGESLASAGGGNPLPAQLEYAGHLLKRAQELEPDNVEWPAALARLQSHQEEVAVSSSPKAGTRIFLFREAQQGNLLQSVDPVYPPLARQARIQGVVRFKVTIGKDGHVSNIVLVSGHPLLVEAAKEAVRQWIYRPTLLNGDPVEVTAADVDVPFVLQHSVDGK